MHFCKAVLSLMSYHQPKSFSNNSLVRIDTLTKVAFSKKLSSFFPKAYLRKQGFYDYEANSIVNITIVDDHLNKREIGAKSPSTYMETFKKTNEQLDKR